MEPFDHAYTQKDHLSDSFCTLETDDVTNQSSTSSGLGASSSLDMDVHGGNGNTTRTVHLRSNQRGHFRFGESQEGFGESFMLEDSFAMGESFSCYEESGSVPDNQRNRFSRERPDITSVLSIEEDEEAEGSEFVDEINSMHELERETRKMAIQTQSSNISVEG